MTTPFEKYSRLYNDSIAHPNEFWAEQALTELEWFEPFTKPFTQESSTYRWFVDGQLNITHNCLDRHINAGHGERLAYICNNERNEEEKVTYTDLLQRVNRAANGLIKLGVTKGDRVMLYMPLTIEQVVLMLACARIGAIHCVVYAGFSAEALAARIRDCGARIICTSTSTQKNGKKHDLISVVRQAVLNQPSIEHVLVHKRKEDQVELTTNEQDLFELWAESSPVLKPLSVESSTPLFILYTSGTTGSPKGIVHGHGGYGLYAHVTMKHAFQLKPEQTHWTAADTGWITGHSYIVYGPLSNGVTSILYEGAPTYPQPDRYWELVDKYKVQSFYTAPTVIRLLMREGEKYPAAHMLSTLKVIGSVGEPINPTAWEWYNKNIGHETASVIDTWWQTETGGHMLVTLPGISQKPGSAGLPFFGIEPQIIDTDGNTVTKHGVPGLLVITQSWPGALMTCWNNPERFEQYWTEFSPHAYFYTGDVAVRDENGYFTILGRADDVINVAGVRVSTAEVESALVSHPSVTEAAVIGISDEIKGEVIQAFVVLSQSVVMSEALVKELKHWVRAKIGYIAEPAKIESVDKLPKTRSGKIMRRILKAKSLGLSVGDTSTLDE